MNWRGSAAFALVFSAGFLAALLISAGRKSSDTASTEYAPASSVQEGSNAESGVASVRATYERRIAVLETELASVRSQAQLAAHKTQELPTTEARLRMMEEVRKKTFERATNRETEMLLAAGFTIERIEFIRRRTQELAEEFRRTEDRLLRQGTPDIDAAHAHSYDRDIGLRAELGVDEYTKYRQALGRSAGVRVEAVLSGGAGEAAGIKAGDEVIAYNGTRVFNMGELVPLQRQSQTSGAPVVVEVLRDGQRIRLSAGAGNLRIQPGISVVSTEDMGRLLENVNANLIESAKARTTATR
jgi:C-terminal processing protease CtpA/Prc